MAFGSAREKLEFLVTADAKGAIKAFNDVGAAADRELGRADQRLDRLGGNFQKFGVAAGGAAVILGGGLLKMAQAADEAQQQQLKLSNAIANSSDASSYNIGALQDQAAALQDVTAADGDAINGMESLLVQLGLTQDEITGLTPLIVDLSRKTGVDLDTAARAVTKALDGQGRALRGMGVDADVAKGASDNLQHVTEALRGSVGGFAEQEGQTFSGQLAILKNNLGDVAEGIGSGVIPAVEKLIGPLESAADWFTNLDDGTQSMVGEFATYGVAALGAIGATSALIGTVIKARDNFSKAATAVSEFAAARGGLGAIGLAAAPAAVGVGIFATAVVQMSHKAQEAEQNTRELGQQIAATGDIAASVRDALSSGDLFAPNIDQHQFFSDLRAAGLTLDDLTASFTETGHVGQEELSRLEAGGRDFQHAMAAAGDDYYAFTTALSDGLATGKITQEQFDNLTSSSHLLAERVGDARDEAQLLDAVNADVAGSTGDVAGAADDAAGGLASEAESAQSVTDRAQELISAVDEVANAFSRLHGETLSATELQSNYEAAIDDLTQSLTDNTFTLDLSTEAGRANTAAAADAAGAVTDLMGARFRETGSVDAAREAGELYVENLTNQLRQAGYTDQQIMQLIDTMNLTPTDLETLVRQVGAEAAQAQVDQFGEHLDAVADKNYLAKIGAAINQGDLQTVSQLLDWLARARTAHININYGIGTTPQVLHGGAGFATGGTTSASDPFIHPVGEGGVPELLYQNGQQYLIPGDSGAARVVPFGSSSGGAMAGPSVVFHIGSIVANSPEQLVDQLERYARTNGRSRFQDLART